MQKISLSQRTFNCEKCSHQEDRDVNAAQNILNRVTPGQGGSNASGDALRPSHMKADVAESGTILGGSR